MGQSVTRAIQLAMPAQALLPQTALLAPTVPISTPAAACPAMPPASTALARPSPSACHASRPTTSLQATAASPAALLAQAPLAHNALRARTISISTEPHA